MFQVWKKSMQTKSLVEGLAWFFIATLFSAFLLIATKAAREVDEAEDRLDSVASLSTSSALYQQYKQEFDDAAATFYKMM